MNKVLSFKEYLVLKENIKFDYPYLNIRQINNFLIESVIEDNIKEYIKNNKINNLEKIKEFENKENVKIDDEYKEKEALYLKNFRWFRNSKGDIFTIKPKDDSLNSGYVFSLMNEDFYFYIYITNNKKLYRYEQNNTIKILDNLVLNPKGIKNIEKLDIKEYPHLQYLTSLINSQLK